jgi:hypothetical protein
MPEKLFLDQNRGDCPNFETSRVLAPFAEPFLGPVEPFILDADRLMRRSAYHSL